MGKYKTPITVIDILGLVVTRRLNRFLPATCWPSFSLPTQLLVWPERSPEDAIVVTITPDYPSSRHTGLVSGLKKFTWYFGSTLCFTTPGDGPRSSPTLLQTHEDSECTNDNDVHWLVLSSVQLFQCEARLCTDRPPLSFVSFLIFWFLASLLPPLCLSKENWFISFSDLLVFIAVCSMDKPSCQTAPIAYRQTDKQLLATSNYRVEKGY